MNLSQASEILMETVSRRDGDGASLSRAPDFPQGSLSESDRELAQAAAAWWRVACEALDPTDLDRWIEAGWARWGQEAAPLARIWAQEAPPHTAAPYDKLAGQGVPIFCFKGQEPMEGFNPWSDPEGWCPLERALIEGVDARLDSTLAHLAREAPSARSRDHVLGSATRAFSMARCNLDWARGVVRRDPALWAGSIDGAMAVAIELGWEEEAWAMARADPSRAMAALGLDFPNKRLGMMLKEAHDPLLGLELALSLGANIDGAGATQGLHGACFNAHPHAREAAKRLMAMGADPRATARPGDSALSQAIRSWSWADLSSILGATAEDLSTSQSRRGDGWEPSLLAALRQCFHALKSADQASEADLRVSTLLARALEAPSPPGEDFSRKALAMAARDGLPRCCDILAGHLASLGAPARAADLLDMAKEGENRPWQEPARALCAQAAARHGLDPNDAVDDPRSAFHGHTLLFAALWRVGQSAASAAYEELGSLKRAAALMELGADPACPVDGKPAWECPESWGKLGERGRQALHFLQAQAEREHLVSGAFKAAASKPRGPRSL